MNRDESPFRKIYVSSPQLHQKVLEAGPLTAGALVYLNGSAGPSAHLSVLFPWASSFPNQAVIPLILLFKSPGPFLTDHRRLRRSCPGSNCPKNRDDRWQRSRGQVSEWITGSHRIRESHPHSCKWWGGADGKVDGPRGRSGVMRGDLSCILY